MSDLLPCPFCGSRAEIKVGGYTKYVMCLGCEVMGSNLSDDAELISQWNRRAPQPSPPRAEVAIDDPGEFGAGILPNPKARYWQERSRFWMEKAIELGWREQRDAAQEADAALKAAFGQGGE